jgi:hypothetical protein
MSMHVMQVACVHESTTTIIIICNAQLAVESDPPITLFKIHQLHGLSKYAPKVRLNSLCSVHSIPPTF